VGFVSFRLHGNQESTPDFHEWNSIASDNGPFHVDERVDVRLEFHPRVSKHEETNFVFIKSKFTQGVGTFSGTLQLPSEVLTIDNMYGVGESHESLW